MPSDPAVFTSAPAAIRISAASRSPLRVTNSNGVNPIFDRASTSAPAAISSRMMSQWRSAVAHISAVCPVVGMAAVTLTSRASSVLTISTPGPGGHHQGRHAVRLGGMGVGTRGQELRNHRGTRVFARERQRGHPLVLGDVDVGAGRQQQIRGVQVVPMRGPQQCGRTIGAHRVHIDTLTQERAHRRPVLGLDGGDEPQIGLRRARTAGHRQERREQQTAETTRGYLPMLPFSRGSLTSR